MVSVLFWKVAQLFLAQLFDLLIQIIKKGYASAAFCNCQDLYVCSGEFHFYPSYMRRARQI